MNWPLVVNSFAVSAGASAGAVAGGFFAALWAVGLQKRAFSLFMAAAAVVLVLPPFLAANCWIELLGQQGLWRRWVPLNIYSLGGSVWILTLLYWPIAFFLVLASWRRVQAVHLEADPLLAGGALLGWLLLPLARTALVQSAILTLVLTLNNFAVPAILQTKVFPAEVWVRFNTTFDYVGALKMSWPLIAGPLLLVAALMGGRARAWSWGAEQASWRSFRRQIGWWWQLGGIVSIFLVAFSLGAPLWQLCESSKTWRQLWPAFAAGQAAIAHSLGYAAASATAVVGLALLLSGRARLETLLWVLFFVPGVLLGIALIWVFNRPGLSMVYQSAGIVVLGYVVRYAALGWSLVKRARARADPCWMDVARSEGANAWQVWRHAVWPQLAVGAAAAWYVTYLLCLWDVETLTLIVPPGGESLSLRVFNLLHYGHNPQVNALCLLLMMLGIVPLVVWACVLRLSAAGARLRRFVPLLLACIAFCAFAGCAPADQKNAVVESKLFGQVRIIGTRGAGAGEFNKPRSVAVDNQDNLYVVDMTGRVQKFSPEGRYLLSWQMPQTDKGKPKGMCCDGEGNIVVIEPHYSRINHFTPEGKLVAQWGVEGTNFGQLGMPRAAAVNSKGEIYVAEYTLSERVQRFSAQGRRFEGAFGRFGDGPGEFSRAEGLGIDRQDRVYVADSCNHRIEIFSPEGKFLRAYGKAGSAPGQFSYPYDVRVDAEGRQYVCEFGNSRIQIFDSAGQLLEILGGPGSGPGQFSNPWAIALDSKGNLYVADSLNHRVQELLRKGQ